MNLTLTIFNISRHLGVGFLLVGLLLTEVHGQPRLSLHIERLDFNGNLLRFPDGTFIAERYGELYRLGPNGQVERKLPFDRTHPVPEITAYNTYFQELLAPLADGGFFAVLDFSLPYLGSVRNRLARFDRDGRMVILTAVTFGAPREPSPFKAPTCSLAVTFPCLSYRHRPWRCCG